MKALSLIALLSFLFLACSKDDKPKSRMDLLTNGPWHVTNYTIDPAFDWDGDGTQETDIYSVMEPCIKDDRTTFHSNGSGELDEGATKCDDSDPQATPFLWNFEQDGAGINVQGIHYTIEALTESQLIVKQTDNSPAATYLHTVTFSH